jgi:hypothetical protein
MVSWARKYSAACPWRVGAIVLAVWSARCEDETQSLDPARLVGNYAFCMMYLLFRRR